MRHLLVYLCVSFCLGIFSAAFSSVSFVTLAALALLFLSASAVFRNKKIFFAILILCAAFFLGAALLKNVDTLPKNHIAKLIPFKKDPVSLVGLVVSDPNRQERNTSFILKAEELKYGNITKPIYGKVLVKVYRQGEFAYGERIIFTGKVYRPFSFSKDFDYRRYLKYQGIYSILSINKTGTWELLEENAGNPLIAFSFSIKHKIRNVFERNLSEFSAGVLNAFILGDRQNLPRYLINMMANLGVVHIIAISGFNVGVVAFIILIVLKVFRIPRRPRYILTILLLIIHCILTGANPPVVRATIMAVILLLGYVLEREVNIYNSLALAAFVILVINPWQLLGISFQLSFLSVVFIVSFTPKIEKLFSKKWLQRSWARFLILTFCVSFAAWFGLMPLIAYYFKIVTPIAVFANMIVVPYATMIIVSGLALAFIGLIFPWLAPILGASNEILILVFFKINYLLVGIPGAYFKLPPISIVAVLVYYSVIFLFLVAKLTNFAPYAKVFQMRKLLIILISILFIACAAPSYAFWIWTPETNKWVNPKYAVKDTPKEQLVYAEEFYQQKDYKKALQEYGKLIQHYPKSREAPQAQLGIGQCYEGLNNEYRGFQEYQKIIEKYPFSDLAPEVIERQYKVGEKLLQNPSKSQFIMTITGGEYDVIDVFRTVIKNAPYGKYAAVSQYKIGLYLSEKKMYQEARDEFEKVVNDYPESEWVKPAKYQIAVVDAARSSGAQYEQAVTKAAKEEFEEFTKSYPDAQLSEKARAELAALNNKEAENNFVVAKFYLKNKKYEAAKIYYNTVVDEYPDTPWAAKAKAELLLIEKLETKKK